VVKCRVPCHEINRHLVKRTVKKVNGLISLDVQILQILSLNSSPDNIYFFDLLSVSLDSFLSSVSASDLFPGL